MENLQDRKEAHQQRASRLHQVWEKYQQQQQERERKNPQSIMQNALSGEESPLKISQKVNLVQKALYAPEDDAIHDGREDKNLAEFVNDLAGAIEKDTFYFEQANSIERINCETSTMNEYFTWIDEGQVIIRHMNDGEVTPEDVKERDDFIDMSFQRETELLTCLGLYERSINMGNTEAKVKFDELRLKLQKLREIRSSIQNSCNHDVNKKVEKNEYEAALEYYRLLAFMRQIGNHPSEEQIEEFRARASALRGYRGVDVEFLAGYSFYTRLVDDVRHADQQERQRQKNDFEHGLSYNRSPGEFLYMAKHYQEKKEDIRSRIERLRGLRPVQKDSPLYDTAQMRHKPLTREGIQKALERLKQQEAMERV